MEIGGKVPYILNFGIRWSLSVSGTDYFTAREISLCSPSTVLNRMLYGRQARNGCQGEEKFSACAGDQISISL
jgi:hypothetical protein